MPIEYEAYGQSWVGINWAATSHLSGKLPEAVVFKTIGVWVRSYLSDQPVDSRARIGQVEAQEFMRDRKASFEYDQATYWREADKDLGVDVDIPTKNIRAARYEGWAIALGQMIRLGGDSKPFLARWKFRDGGNPIYFAAMCNGGDVAVFSPRYGETRVPASNFSDFLVRFRQGRAALRRAIILELTVDMDVANARPEAIGASLGAGQTRPLSPAPPSAKRPRLGGLPSLPLDLLDTDDLEKTWQELRQHDPEQAAAVERLWEELAEVSDVG